MTNQSFERSQRLLTANEYKAVFDDAPLRVSHARLLLLARPNSIGRARLGLIVAKKHVRLAVGRNKIKRIVRETFRQHSELSCVDVVVLARPGIGSLDKSQLHQLLKAQWLKLIKKQHAKR